MRLTRGVKTHRFDKFHHIVKIKIKTLLALRALGAYVNKSKQVWKSNSKKYQRSPSRIYMAFGKKRT